MKRTAFLLLGLLLTLSLTLTGCGGSSSPDPSSSGSGATVPDANAQPVTLVIELDARARTFADIPWTSGMTVKDVMEQAEDDAGKLSFDYAGRGETAILSAIDGVENQGAGRAAKNWLYWVGDTFATRSFAIAPVEPGQTVTWRFAPYDAAGE